MAMCKFVVLCLLIHLTWGELSCPSTPPGLHKESPSPEELKGCKKYSCNSCCTVESSKELAMNPLQSAGRWNFTQCNRTLTNACSATFSEIMCFFKCSPNLYVFENKVEGFRKRIPLCKWFCDRWFTTCMNDLTCVMDENWVTGYKHTSGEVDTCFPSSKCRNYTQVYGGDEDKPGKTMCDQLFGDAFEYSEDEDLCLDPFQEQHNVEIINQFFNGTKETQVCEEEVSSYTDAGMIVGIVFGVLGGIFIILAALAFYKRKKDSKSKNIKKPEEGTAQELATMTTAPVPVTLPKDDSSSDE